MAPGRRRLVLAAMGFSVLIVVLTLLAVPLLRVDVEARDWAIAIATAVVVGGFLTLLVMRRGLEDEALQQRVREAHVPDEGLRPTGARTAFDLKAEHVVPADGRAPAEPRGDGPDAGPVKRVDGTQEDAPEGAAPSDTPSDAPSDEASERPSDAPADKRADVDRTSGGDATRPDRRDGPR